MRTRHLATVEPYTGSGAYGDVYGPPFLLPCNYQGVRQLVRGSDGSEAVSEGTLYADPPGTLITLPDGSEVEIPEVPAGSKVTILDRETWVITVSTFDGRLGSHIEVALA